VSTPPPDDRSPIVREAPAKLNLTLAVIRRRPDGYHALHSVMVPLKLADTISVSVAEAPPQSAPNERLDPAARRDSAERADSLAVSGFEVPCAGDNLVLQAIARARAAVAGTWPGAPAVPPALAAELIKRVPVAAGLGGGSSDAALALDAALEAWDSTLSIDRAMALAAALGSDVPFFLAGGAARISGRGEFVDPLPDLQGRQPAVLLVTPRMAVSTREVFAAFSRGARPADAEAAQEVSERLAADMTAGLDGAALLERAAELATSNDLLAASVAVSPTLLPFRRALARLLGLPVGQSGSGPTCWILYPTVAAARKAGRSVEAAVSSGVLPEIGHGRPFVAATTILTRPKPAVAAKALRTAGRPARTAGRAITAVQRAGDPRGPGDPRGRTRGHRVPRGAHNVVVSESDPTTRPYAGESPAPDRR
jgi:4-diphosphocytidyl-2-C-methyl-D-erythritol kinase